MADEKVPQKDILAIFKRLKSIGENKSCFDCGASNPTWASITYGVFLCIDCSAVHRGLGVHLTFIRSIQLDTNWTWLQIRNMQCGGNGKANAFFRQHNLSSQDAAYKYKSRVASMYREKLSSLSQKAMREHGTTVHLGQHAGHATTPEQKEVDFFNEIEHQETKLDSTNFKRDNQIQNGIEEHKHVDVGHLSTSPPKKDVRVPTIGGRKPAAKKKGLGTKKTGLGATKTKANFSAIENEVQQQDKIREQANIQLERDISPTSSNDKTPDDIPLSSALVYKTASMRKEEEKLKQVDPKKAAQLERLGMGFSGKGNISHSVSDSMQTVEQIKPDSSYSNSHYDSYSSNASNDGFFDSFDNFGISSSKSYDKGISEEPPSYETHFVQKDNWGSSSNSYKSERDDVGNSRSRSKAQTSYTDTSEDDFRKTYGNAKGISSEQLFGTNSDSSIGDRLDQFQSSSGISSADVFGEKKEYSSRSVDYQNIKDSVSNVTGKLSSMASGVIGSLQSRYSGNN